MTATYRVVLCRLDVMLAVMATFGWTRGKGWSDIGVKCLTRTSCEDTWIVWRIFRGKAIPFEGTSGKEVDKNILVFFCHSLYKLWI